MDDEEREEIRQAWGDDRACFTCVYFDDQGAGRKPRCRINPPVADSSSKIDGATGWPIVSSSDWCGKHRPAWPSDKTGNLMDDLVYKTVPIIDPDFAAGHKEIKDV